MRILMLLLLFIVAGTCAAAPLTVESLHYQDPATNGDAAATGQITMPFVRGGGDGVAAAINEQLFQGQFNVPAPVLSGGHFTLIEGADIPGRVSQAFTVSRNDDRILSIAFDNEGCGAYCESYTVYYSFDVKTGKKLDPEAVFTADGLRNLRLQLHRSLRAEYLKQLAALRQQLKEAHRNRQAADASDLQERIELNSGCVGEGQHTDRTPRVTEAVRGFGYDKYEFGAMVFRLTRGRCSNHAMRALDDVGDYTLELPYAALSAYLTDYGRRLLLDKPAGKTAKKVAARIDYAGDEAMLFFPAPPMPQETETEPSPPQAPAVLAWEVGGDPVPAGDGWRILACTQGCALRAARLRVRKSTLPGGEEVKIPAQQLQWSPVPAGQIVAIFKPVNSLAALQLKAGAVKTWLHVAMEGYPQAPRADTMEIVIPLDNAQTAVLVPRVLQAGAGHIDRLELRANGKRQMLPGYKLASTDEVLDAQEVLRWAGDLDGDGKLDLVISHDSQQVDVAFYLSSLAQPGELVGLAGSMRYEQQGGGD